MRTFASCSLAFLTLFISPRASAEFDGAVHVRFFGDSPGALLEAIGPLYPGELPAVLTCVLPCATELAGGKYRLRLDDGSGRPADVRPRLKLVAPIDVFVERVDLARKRRRQRITAIVLASVGVLLIIPGAAATRCASRRDTMDGVMCSDELADGLGLGAASLALGGLFLGLSFGPRERVTLSTFDYGTVR